MIKTKVSIVLLSILFNGCMQTNKQDKIMDEENYKLKVVRNFIHSYNAFDIDGMITDLHHDIKFENISNGQVDLVTNGIDEFRKQAELAGDFFKERECKIIDTKAKGNRIEVLIDYVGILSRDIPGGLHAGDTLKLKGKSVYTFNDNKIVGIQDISE